MEETGVLLSGLVTLEKDPHLGGFHGDTQIEGAAGGPGDTLTLVEIDGATIDWEDETLIQEEHGC